MLEGYGCWRADCVQSPAAVPSPLAFAAFAKIGIPATSSGPCPAAFPITYEILRWQRASQYRCPMDQLIKTRLCLSAVYLGCFQGGKECDNELWQLRTASRTEGAHVRLTFLWLHTQLLRGNTFIFPHPPRMFTALTLAIFLLFPHAYLAEMNSTRCNVSKRDSCSKSPLQLTLWEHSASLPLMAICFPQTLAHLANVTFIHRHAS